jgi:hypothetical protein
MLACLAVMMMPPLSGQVPDGLETVRSFYVESFGDKPGCAELHDSLVARLRRLHGIQVVSDRSRADIVVSGIGEIWIRGYYSLNPRVRDVTLDAQPIYDGYLSVELKGTDDKILWSYLVTPRRPARGGMARKLADAMVKRIAEALGGKKKDRSDGEPLGPPRKTGTLARVVSRGKAHA